MKKRLTAWALLFITVFVGMSVCIPSYAADNTKQYNPKAVAVVYDNSGSMISASDQRQGYAEYALQSLVSLLNPQDALAVVPMTANGAKRYLDVDLSSANRQAAVDGALAFASQNYSHTTPGSSVADGVKVLTDAYGMVRQDDLTAPETDAYDYWLIVLTDGVFDATVSASSDTDRTEKILSAQMGIYRNLHIVFFSFGSDSNIVDMTKSKNALFQNNPSFSAYYAADATQITERMGRIANQLTGRYNADGVSMTGNKVVLDLSRCPCALRNVSFLLQNSDAVLTGVEYAPAQVQASRSCSLKVHQDIASGLKGGSTAVISGTGSISGGTMTLTFSKPLDGARLSVMYEPALYIKTVLYAKNQKGLWEETTVQSINETKRPGDLFRISYGVYEEGTDVAVNLKEMFKEEPDVRIFYGKNAVTPDTDTALSMGDNEINISVSVLDGGYNMYDTLNLKVSQNPTDFRVESHFVPGEPNTVLFTVYDDNHALTASAITGYQKEITVTDKAGNAVPFSSFVKADGSVQVTVDFPDAAYGAYSVSMKITSPNRLKRYGSLTLGYYPEEMSLIAGEPISTSVFGLSENRQTLSFALSSGGQPLDINEGLGYRVTCNGKDCTEWVTVTGNALTLCPRTELFGTPVPGDYRFAAEVYVKANPTQKVSSAATLTVTETLYALTARSEGEAADRFDVGSGNAAAYYEFERDGKKLDAATVSSMIEDGTITLPEFVEQDFLRTVRLSYEVSDRDGVGVLKMAMTQNGGDFANFFSSMFLKGGEKKIAVSFAGLTETATLAVKKLSGFSSYLPYLLRGLLIFLAGYTLLYLFFLLRYFSGGTCISLLPSGVVINMTVTKNGNGEVRKLQGGKAFINPTPFSRAMVHIIRLVTFRAYSYTQVAKTSVGEMNVRLEAVSNGTARVYLEGAVQNPCLLRSMSERSNRNQIDVLEGLIWQDVSENRGGGLDMTITKTIVMEYDNPKPIPHSAEDDRIFTDLQGLQNPLFIGGKWYLFFIRRK